MRHLCLAALSLAVLAQPAAAQQSGSPMGDIMDMTRFVGRPSQWAATIPAPLAGLTPVSRKWIAAETTRQIEAPRSAVDVAMAVDAALDKDIRRVALDKRVKPQDISSAIVLRVMMGAKAAATRDAKTDPKGGERLAEANANYRDAMALQSQVSLALATK